MCITSLLLDIYIFFLKKKKNSYKEICYLRALQNG